jgi:hypothetical protein
MKNKETIEEAAESWLKSKTLLKTSQAPGLLIGFIEGAKWQQENTNINALNFEIDALKKQIKLLEHNQQIMYNKEDVILILMEYDYSLVNEGKLNSIGNIKKWFEQFKNK